MHMENNERCVHENIREITDPISGEVYEYCDDCGYRFE